MDPRAISDRQRDMMWHAVGDGKGYRNRYAAPKFTETSRAWDALVVLGLAVAGCDADSLTMYHLTPRGVDVVAEKMGLGKKKRAALLVTTEVT